MNTIIVDDETPSVTLLKKFASKIPFLTVNLATTNAFEALEFVKQNPVDLILLDIEMPDISGIEFINQLEKKPQIIFTTAYENYAIKGFDLNVTDYLLKPIPFDRFAQAIHKAQNSYESQVNSEQYIEVKSEYKTIRINYEDILFIEGLKDYVKIHTKDKTILTRLNVKGIEKKLPLTKFIRVHRSFIIAKSKITTFQKHKLTIGNAIIPISKRYIPNPDQLF